MIELLLAAAMLLPLNPDGDQATLDRLAKQGMQVAWGYPSTALSWDGENCKSRLNSLQGRDNAANFEIDWSRATIRPLSDGIRLGEVSRHPGRLLTTIDLTFPDEAAREAALAAMGRLKAACTPQR